jgi:hypothetical protein
LHISGCWRGRPRRNSALLLSDGLQHSWGIGIFDDLALSTGVHFADLVQEILLRHSSAFATNGEPDLMVVLIFIIPCSLYIGVLFLAFTGSSSIETSPPAKRRLATHGFRTLLTWSSFCITPLFLALLALLYQAAHTHVLQPRRHEIITALTFRFLRRQLVFLNDLSVFVFDNDL